MVSRQNTKILFFLLSFLSAQAVVMFAEFDHPLHEPDSSCDICLAVDHLSNGVITIESDHHLLAQHEVRFSTNASNYFISLLSAYSVRAPPLL